MSTPYVVIDLEATCDQRGFPRKDMEIIEIGAVLVDGESLSVRGEFQTFVQPVVRRELTPFCRELTSITQADVDSAPRFPEALRQLAEWMPAKHTFGSWGAYDRGQFEQDAARHGLSLPFVGEHLNIKRAFAAAVRGRPMGMKRALRVAGLPLQGTHHRGIDDARNIAKLLPFALGRVTVGRG